MQEYTLLVMAAGMGSRYGGLKQLDYMSEQNDILMDFSIRDAIDAGFNKIVFVVRSSFKDEFEALQNKKLANQPVSLHYVCQEIEDIPKGYNVLSERKKPWGTGHAMLVTKGVIKEPFIAINADDFYGKDAFQTIFKKLKELRLGSHDMCMVSYFLKNTVPNSGYVSRGVCAVKNRQLESIVERTHIEKTAHGIIRKDEEGIAYPMAEDTVVSMNFWGFTPKFFEALEVGFKDFLATRSKELKSEYFVPTAVNELINAGKGKVAVLTSNAKWMGITYNEDKDKVFKAITQMKAEKIYPIDLWG